MFISAQSHTEYANFPLSHPALDSCVFSLGGLDPFPFFSSENFCFSTMEKQFTCSVHYQFGPLTSSTELQWQLLLRLFSTLVFFLVGFYSLFSYVAQRKLSNIITFNFRLNVHFHFIGAFYRNLFFFFMLLLCVHVNCLH